MIPTGPLDMVLVTVPAEEIQMHQIGISLYISGADSS
jgi:hypothetical protein